MSHDSVHRDDPAETDDYSGSVNSDENIEHVEVGSLPAAVIEQAKANPGGSVAQIDSSMVPNPDGFVPPEAVIGAYEVGDDGLPTGVYRRNPKYGLPILDDWTRLESPDHWFGWLGDSPSAAVRHELDRAVTDQIPGTVVEWVKILSDPELLTGGPREAESDRVIVRRAALAVEFAMSVMPPNGRREFLVGSFSWVAVGLDTTDGRHDRTWFDIGMPIARAGELLNERIWEIE